MFSRLSVLKQRHVFRTGLTVGEKCSNVNQSWHEESSQSNLGSTVLTYVWPMGLLSEQMSRLKHSLKLEWEQVGLLLSGRPFAAWNTTSKCCCCIITFSNSSSSNNWRITSSAGRCNTSGSRGPKASRSREPILPGMFGFDLACSTRRVINWATVHSQFKFHLFAELSFGLCC